MSDDEKKLTVGQLFNGKNDEEAKQALSKVFNDEKIQASIEKLTKNFREFEIVAQEIAKPIISVFESIARLIPPTISDDLLAISEALRDFNQQCDDAEKQAKEILELSKTSPLSHFLALGNIPPMTILMLIGILDDDVQAKISATREMAIKEHFSNLAKKGAPNRHRETNELKKEAKEYWLKHIDRKLSNEKAADKLKKIIPLSHRKLQELVSEAKKELKNI